MKRNQKGFTLIELLAVIVILAIIALIATPMVLKYINDSREGAAESDCYAAMKAAELYYAEQILDSKGAPTEVLAENLELKNNTVTGTIEFVNSGEATTDELVVDGTYYCYLSDNEFECGTEKKN